MNKFLSTQFSARFLCFTLKYEQIAEDLQIPKENVQHEKSKQQKKKKKLRRIGNAGKKQTNEKHCSPALQARILKWVAVLFSRGSSQPRD